MSKIRYNHYVEFCYLFPNVQCHFTILFFCRQHFTLVFFASSKLKPSLVMQRKVAKQFSTTDPPRRENTAKPPCPCLLSDDNWCGLFLAALATTASMGKASLAEKAFQAVSHFTRQWGFAVRAFDQSCGVGKDKRGDTMKICEEAYFKL